MNEVKSDIQIAREAKMQPIWGKVSGHPVLLNTSLNIKGQPIVNDEYDAKVWSETHGIRVFQ